MSLPAVLLLLALHALAGDGYGYFRDELYYLACADHLAWGYVDQPPLSIALLAAWRWWFGDSILALRALPALAGAAMLVLTVAMVMRLGGGRYARVLASLGFIAAPIYLGMHGYYSMNAWDMLLWALAEYLLLQILQANDDDSARGSWLGLGLVLGLGLLNKFSVLWLGAGLLGGLLATPQRRRLRQVWPYAAAGLALLLFSPHLWWQWQQDFPTFEFMRNAAGSKYLATPPLSFLGGVVTIMNPATALLWIAGLAWTFQRGEGRRYRLFGVLFVTVLVILLLNGTSKPEYLAPIFPFFLAAGAVVLERAWLQRRRLLRLAYPLLVAVLGLVIAPLALPVLPVQGFVAYTRALGIAPQTSERKELGELPQFYADRHGWPELAAEVAKAYNSLPQADRARAAIIARNYGEAGAIDFFGRPLGLPPARSQHNNYYLWGYGDFDGSVAIVLRASADDIAKEFDSVQKLGEFSHRYAMPYENHLGIYLCKGLHQPIAKVWRDGKNYN